MLNFEKETIAIRNPRTGQNDYEIVRIGEQDLQHLTLSLRKGQHEWSQKAVSARVAALQAWKQGIENHKAELVEALSIDTGRQWESILEADVVATSIDRWCGIAGSFFSEPTHKKTAIPFLEIEQGLVPYSLVGVISPWNFPLLLSLIDTIPALLAGCAVVVKPSEVTPRFIAILQKTINEVPELASVLQYVAGDGQTGGHLVNLVDLVCFTGSTATGRKVYQAACDKFIPVFLELGGKDAALVFEGANIDLATSALLWGSTVNAGQSCLSIERVYVQETIFAEFTNVLSKKAADIGLAYPAMESGKIGPIISDKQVIIINEHLRDALQKGAKILTGSQQCEELGGGYYCKPTVVTGVNHQMKLMNEETFGPIIPVMPFSTEEEAVSLANGTMYGLSGAVFAKDNETAIRIGQQMTAGAISINDAALTAIMHEGEKNSFKMSGIGGTRMGPSAIKRFMRQKAYLIKNTAIKDPWWF